LGVARRSEREGMRRDEPQDWIRSGFADPPITKWLRSPRRPRRRQVSDAGRTVLPCLIDASRHLVPALSHNPLTSVTTVSTCSATRLVASEKERAAPVRTWSDVLSSGSCHRALRAPVDITPVPDLAAADQAAIRGGNGRGGALSKDHRRRVSFPRWNPGTSRHWVQFAAHTRGLLVFAPVSSTAGAGRSCPPVVWWPTVPADADRIKALALLKPKAVIVVCPTLPPSITPSRTCGAAGCRDPRSRWKRSATPGHAGFTSDSPGWHGRRMPPTPVPRTNLRRLALRGSPC